MATWSGIRHKLEKHYLAESLRGHIEYFVTTYNKSHDQLGRAAIKYDGKEIMSGGYYRPKGNVVDLRPDDMNDDVALKMGYFYEGDFYMAFHEFDNQSIEKSLQSDNLIVRIFAILDKRIGKKRLVSLRAHIQEEPEIFQLFYNIRANAEKI